MGSHPLRRWPIHGTEPSPEPLKIGAATLGQYGALADLDRFSGELPTWQPVEFSQRISFVAMRGNTLVGFVAFKIERRRITILRLVVAPHERRRRAGLQLINRVLAFLVEFGGRNRVVCRVRESNTAGIGLLAACGFSETVLDRNHYADTGEDGYRFVYRVAPTAALSIAYGPDGRA